MLVRAMLAAILLLLSPSLILAAQVSFNTNYTALCLADGVGCPFNNASLWIPAPPTSNDTVLIDGGVNVVLLIITEPVVLQGLVLVNASLTISVNQSLVTSSLTLDTNSLLTLTNLSWVQSWQTNSSSFVLSQGASLAVNDGGVFNWNANATFLGSLTVGEGATFFSAVANFAPTSFKISSPANFGTVNVLSGSSPQFSGLSGLVNVAAASSVTVEVSLVGQVNVEGTLKFQGAGNVTLISNGNTPALAGTGTFSVVTASAIIHNANSSNFNGTLTIGGISTVDIQNLAVSNWSFIVGINSEPANPTVYGNGLVFSGAVTAPGTLFVYGTGGVNVVTAVEFSVAVNANNTQITIPQSGVLLTPVLGVANTQITLGGTLHSPLDLPAGSSLTSANANANIVGNLVNNGNINLDNQKVLQIWSGDYVNEAGSISVSLDAENQAALKVLNGSIRLNAGKLQFSITEAPFLRSATFLVAWANATLNGTFTGDAEYLAGSAIKRSLGIAYDTQGKAIYIKYSFNPADVAPWVWAVFSVAVVLIIVIIVIVVIKCKKRSQYQAV